MREFQWLVWSFFLGISVAQADYSEKPQCEKSKQRFSKSHSLGVECTPQYLHYCHQDPGQDLAAPCKNADSNSKTESARTEELRIAGFNVLNLGAAKIWNSKQTRFKKIDLLAQLIHRWDLVAVVEIKHFAPEDERINAKIDEAIPKSKNGKIWKDVDGDGDRTVVSEAELRTHYILPAYLELLHALHQHAREWSLILAPTLNEKPIEEGKFPYGNELAAFFYRSDRVTPTQTLTCNGQVACVAPRVDFLAEVEVEGEEVDFDLIDKKPFLAAFASGNFEFAYVAEHIRSPAPKEKWKQKVLEDALSKQFNAAEFGIRAKAELARFSEVATLFDFLGDIQSRDEDEDLIVFGDFNLPIESTSRKDYDGAWKAALEKMGGAEVHVSEKTTLGTQHELANSFDHFVFRSSNCTHDGAFNFTDSKLFPALQQEIELAKQEEAKDQLRRELGQERKLKGNKLIARYTEKQIKAVLENDNHDGVRGYQQRIQDSARDETLWVEKEFISDHLPISMRCQTGV